MELSETVRKDALIFLNDGHHVPLTKKGDPLPDGKRMVLDHRREYAAINRRINENCYRLSLDERRFDIDSMLALFEFWRAQAIVLNKNSDVKTVDSHWNKHIKPMFALTNPTDLSTGDIFDLVVVLSGRGLGKRTICNVMGSLKRLIFFAWKIGILQALPTFITIDNNNFKLRDVMNISESRDFLSRLDASTCDQHKLGIIKSMLLMGLREGEALSMTFDKVRNGYYIVNEMKSKAPRSIPIPNEVMKHLIASNESQKGLIFRARDGADGSIKQHSSQFCIDLVKQIGREIGKTNLVQHDLRASFASIMAHNNCAMSDLSLLLGHASVRTTERYVFALNRSAAYQHGLFLALLGVN